jgi:hypothetical protein
MATDVAKASRYVESVVLPEPPPLRFDVPKAATLLTAAKEQAAVVGSDVVSFVVGIAPEHRRDIVNAALLAQLVAKKKVQEPATLKEVEAWYREYFDVLSNLGFVMQEKGFAEYAETSKDFAAHEAILEVAAALLGPSPAALALVKTTLEALKKASGNASWITLFNRESQSAQTARFQFSLVEGHKDEQLLMTLMAFGLEAEAKLTQVLFFRFRANTVKLRHSSGKVTVSTEVLAGVREKVAAKLVPFVNDYIEQLPEL